MPPCLQPDLASFRAVFDCVGYEVRDYDPELCRIGFKERQGGTEGGGLAGPVETDSHLFLIGHMSVRVNHTQHELVRIYIGNGREGFSCFDLSRSKDIPQLEIEVEGLGVNDAAHGRTFFAPGTLYGRYIIRHQEYGCQGVDHLIP